MLSDLRRRGAEPTPRVISALLIFLVIGGTLAMRPDLTSAKVQIPAVGEQARREVRAWRSLRVPDRVETERRREAAQRQVEAVYDYEPDLVARQTRLLREAYSVLAIEMASIERRRQELQAKLDEGADPGALGGLDAINTHRKRVQLSALRSLGIAGVRVDFDGLDPLGYNRPVADALSEMLHAVYRRPVVAERELVSQRAPNGIVLRSGASGEDKRLSVEALDDLRALRLQVAEVVGSRLDRLANRAKLEKVSGRSRSAVVELLGRMVVPTASFNAAATRQERESAAQRVPLVVVPVSRGEVLIREGDTITPAHVALLGALNESSAVSAWLTALGAGLLIVLLVMCVHWFAQRHIQRYRPDARDLAFMVITLVGMMTLCAVGSSIVESVAAQYTSLSLSILRPLVPVSAGALVIGFVLSGASTLVFVVVSSPLLAYALYGEVGASIPIAVAGFVGSSLIAGAHRRVEFLRAGLAAGLAGWLCSLGYSLLVSGAVSQEMGYEGLTSIFGGLITAMVIPAATPGIEWALKYMTNLRMAELATMEHPVLRELAMRAPGSHHHSMMVAALSEAGALATGRNALLVKVMAYYHDIGKMNHPEYFAENQGRENPHDKVKPSISALIIRKHVTEGLEMAKKYGFEEEILDGIATHHGTRVISYFYKKAQEQAAEGERVEQADYTYPGPKPQDAESAILMIADSIEAAARSLPDPNPDRLRGLVQKITNKIFSEGQLDECDLTLRDLHNLAQAFHKVLCGIYHHRPQYQESAAKERRDVSTSSTQHQREPQNTPKPSVSVDDPEATPDDEEHLRRLGTG
ncbi:MAG: HDIG domain-containing metalloprotein [Myxococcota bacterium]|nr:HDIG domain-containing metalloprotein [Myxococcota bacterium]